jgi:hypothetical protein
MLAAESPQKLPEVRNDVADKLGKLMERWEQRITPGNRRFDERFLVGEIHILIVFRCAQTGEVRILHIESDSAHNSVLSRQNDEVVLVGVIQLPEQPERIVPVLVWLEPINRFHSLPPHTLYVSNLSGFITLRGMEYRELNLRPVFGSGFSRCNASGDKLKSEMVKSASEIVDDISGNSGNVESVNMQRIDFEDWFSKLGLSLYADRLSGRFAQGQDDRFQIVEMLIGPFNFYADQSDSVVGKH